MSRSNKNNKNYLYQWRRRADGGGDSKILIDWNGSPLIYHVSFTLDTNFLNNTVQTQISVHTNYIHYTEIDREGER